VSNELGNRRNAVANASYYDRLWPALGRKLHETELMRAEFVVNGLRNLASPPPCEILDLGCGRGWFAPFLAPYGSVTGVDYAEKGIRLAREYYGEYCDFRLAESTSDEIGLAEYRRFDVVVSSEVIEHVEDHIAFVRQLRHLLKPGGLLFLTTPNGNVWDRFVHDRRYVHALQPTENWLSPSKLSQILRAEGFLILTHEGRAFSGARYGRQSFLQRRSVQGFFKAIGWERRYGRWILMDALYQVVAARLDGEVSGSESPAAARDR